MCIVFKAHRRCASPNCNKEEEEEDLHGDGVLRGITAEVSVLVAVDQDRQVLSRPGGNPGAKQ